MKIKIYVFATLSSLILNTSFAESLMPMLETNNCSPFVTLSLGPALTLGSTKKFSVAFLSDSLTYNYSRKKAVFGSGDLYLGWQGPINMNVLGQVGLSIAGSPNVPIQGKIWQGYVSNPTYYRYSYDVAHQHAALKFKFMTDTNRNIQPYISGALGIGSNQSSHLKIRPQLTEDSQPVNLTSETTHQFVYTLGFGIQTAYSTNWHFGWGYEFADWGSLKFSTQHSQNFNSRVNSSNLYVNQLLFSLTYVFSAPTAMR